ncbi:hypothetical protein [Actinomadura rupiterrae]|uniref:hypothetical protein n=1 Tax=Actinomadura rupiterrae TaxID=559627 RepID=UPI0020A34CD1|nr:hypothetical protein [Actinomadura rupiterrae]MCP2338416.1 hypothetical protein [Actinomadura rupiterrae]
MTAEMRTGPASRDGDFRGIDPPALDQLLRQVQQANAAIRGWLAGHRPPPGVPATGYRQAEQVAQWASDQIGMLSRRYNFAITHPDTGGGVHAPPAPAPAPGPGSSGGGGGTKGPGKVTPPRSHPRPHRTTPNGAGDLGKFRTPEAAAKAARSDAHAIRDALQHHRAVPPEAWKHLAEHAGDPDYTRELYERLGAKGAAELIKAAHGNAAHLKAIERSLGVASHHMTMNARWLDALLDESDRLGDHKAAVHVLTTADMSARTANALAKLGLHHVPAHAPHAPEHHAPAHHEPAPHHAPPAHHTPAPQHHAPGPNTPVPHHAPAPGNSHAPAPPRHPIQPPAAPDPGSGNGPTTLVHDTIHAHHATEGPA